MQVRGLKAWHSHVVRYLGVRTPTDLKQLNEDSLRTMAAAAQMTLDSALIARVLKAIRLTDGEVAAATLEPSEPGSARSTVASEDGWEGTPRSVQWPSGVDFSKIDSVICKLFDRFDDEKAAREAFSRLDRARSKRLSASDLRNGLKNEYQIRTDENMAVYLVAALDGDGDRRLCAQDFAYGQKLARLGFLRRKIRAFTTAKYNNDLAKHFHAMCGATDTLSFPKFKQEIRTRAKVSPSQMSEPELREIFSFFDTDVNSCIDWDEFDAVMSDGALSKIPRPNIRAAVASGEGEGCCQRGGRASAARGGSTDADASKRGAAAAPRAHSVAARDGGTGPSGGAAGAGGRECGDSSSRLQETVEPSIRQRRE